MKFGTLIAAGAMFGLAACNSVPSTFNSGTALGATAVSDVAHIGTTAVGGAVNVVTSIANDVNSVVHGVISQLPVLPF